MEDWKRKYQAEKRRADLAELEVRQLTRILDELDRAHQKVSDALGAYDQRHEDLMQRQMDIQSDIARRRRAP